MKMARKTKKKKTEALTLPQATRRFTRHVKRIVAGLTVLLLALMVLVVFLGYQGNIGFTNWFGKDGWVAVSFSEAYYNNNWVPCIGVQGEETLLTLAELTDHIQQYTKNRLATDSFYAVVYDADGNAIASSDSYENRFYPAFPSGVYSLTPQPCEFAGQTVDGRYHTRPSENGHSHFVAYEGAVPFLPGVREERKDLPGWFRMLYNRADGDAFMGTATDLTEMQQLLTEKGEGYPWYHQEERASGLHKFRSIEAAYLRPVEVEIRRTGYWEYIQTSLEDKGMDTEASIHTQLYQLVGYGPAEEVPEGCELFYVCTAGVYSKLYAYVLEVNNYFSSAYVVLLMLYILLLVVCIFIEYRKFSVVQKQTIQSQRDLLVTVAHELKTPMGVVRLHDEKITHSGDMDEIKTEAQALHEEVTHMNDKLMDMLTVSRLDNMPRMPVEPARLDDMLEDLCNEFLPLMEEKGITLQADIAPGVTAQVNAFYIRKAAHNYLSNAVKFTPRDGHIAIKLAVEKKNVRVSVFNSGARIDAEDEKRIWGSFAKVSDGGDNRDKGTGLGLSIVRSVVQLHGGSYGCGNREDGVEFWFAVPL